ncbi:ATP-binding protein [Pseudomonas sp. 5P_3.1_Bac2]|uniref:ATP-binding protein n=1 Tax=Pseudomonas sp. 5P_3.1_Bac2 TaxID=2971617 RepID=UPI0021C87A36|nr:transporter substrate-binding domain-containing protein [Pseudomonas sp. 5P_3.1_Bac2]MCU1719455.1 transporter substrate-binding domain-containing protein [Pseudomonas sp. 5P_3.1_Bac2]
MKTLSWFIVLCLALPNLSYALSSPVQLELWGRSHKQAQKLNLSEQQWRWLRNKESLRLGVSQPNNRPFDITISGQRYEGLSADYAALLAQLLGVPISVTLFNNRLQAREALKNGEIDLLSSANLTDTEQQSRVLSDSYVPEQTALYSRLNEKRMFPANLAGVKIAVADNYLTPGAIREYFPSALLQTFNTPQEALAALAFGHADLYLGDTLSANLLINEQYFNYVTIERIIKISPGGTSFALRKSDELLRQIINQALQLVTPQQASEIIRRWGGGSGTFTRQQLDLSPSEQNWVNRHPIVRVAMSIDQAPVAFIDEDDNFAGIMSDILKMVSLRTGQKFEATRFDEITDLSEALANNSADLTVLTQSLAREATMRFSLPFSTMPFCLVTRDGRTEFSDLNSLRGHRVAISKGHILFERLQSVLHDVNIVESKNFVDTLNLVHNNQADVTIAPLNVARYYLQHGKDLELKIVGIIEPDSALFSFAMRRADTELQSILNKVLQDIPPDELNVISTRWRANTSLRDTSLMDYHTLILQIAGSIALLIGAAVLWNLNLQRQVRQRRAAEQALGDQLHFMRTLIDGTPLPIYVRDRQGRLLSCNQSYLNAVDLDEADVVGKTSMQGVKNNHQQARSFHAEYLQAMATGQASAQDRTLTLNDQVLRIYHWIHPYRDRQGEVQGVICGWLDISERQQLIEQLQSAKEEADEASRAKTTFLATMSHEIRTPMSAIIGMLELALKKRASDGRFDPSTIEVAYASAKGLLELIGDILDIVRIESGRLNLAPRRSNLRELAESVVRVFDGLARQKGLNLTLDFDFESGSAIDVLIDPVRFKQILSNLISNAIKFTDKGQVQLRINGTLLAEERIQLDIQVSDSGIGISAKDQARLFQPFAQAGSHTSAARGGTGLGLAICRALCEMMGGTLSLNSEPGTGTQVSLQLTLSCMPALGPRDQHAAEAGPITASSLQVLIVDDHPANLLLLAQQLEFLGHHVSQAKDGAQALECWNKQTFDLVITDCNMPNMNGYQLAETIRAAEAQRQLPPCTIFGYTANAQPEEQERCLQAGMNQCLFKPISLTELTAHTATVPPLVAPATPAKTFSSEVVNLTTTLQLTQGDHARSQQLLGQLLSSNRDDLAELIQLAQQQDRLGISAVAHKIRGAARIVQARHVIAACEAMERLAQDATCSASQLQSAATTVAQALQELEQAILAQSAANELKPG